MKSRFDFVRFRTLREQPIDDGAVKEG